MFRLFQRTVLALAIAGAVTSASAFSLLGPYATWQTAAIGYNVGGIDLGGVMNLGEEYRWNIQTITYGFDKSFLDYFGQRGVDEVNKAIAILNALPPFSKMSSNLTEYPQDTRRINYQANSLALIDLKSFALGMLVEELGLADPERYVWTLRNRTVLQNNGGTNYWVVMRNFDPVTLIPTPYVNGTLYTYAIFESGQPLNYSDASEFTVDPLAFGFNSVAGITGSRNPSPSSYFTSGAYFTGLTRDDIGGLRYIYAGKRSFDNVNVEGLLPDVAPSGSLGPWSTFVGTTNSFPLVVTAPRPGVDRLVFKQIKYYGQFPAITNTYTDTFLDVTNNRLMKQRTQRVLTTQPDILFAAGDLGVDGISGAPFLTANSDTSAWLDGAALNSQASGFLANIMAGPGVIVPPVIISFSSVGPFLGNHAPGFLSQANPLFIFGGWAAFDGTTNEPVVFPVGSSIQQVLNGGQ